MDVSQLEAEVFSCFTLFLGPILPEEAPGPPARSTEVSPGPTRRLSALQPP